MTARAAIMGVLMEAPSTTRDIALELWGDDSPYAMRKVSWHISAMRQAGIHVERVGQVAGTGNRKLNLWAIQEGGT